MPDKIGQIKAQSKKATDMMQLAITFMTIGALMVAAILVDGGNRHYMPGNVATWTIWGGNGR